MTSLGKEIVDSRVLGRGRHQVVQRWWWRRYRRQCRQAKRSGCSSCSSSCGGGGSGEGGCGGGGGHVRSWRKSLGGVSLSPLGIRRIFRFAGKRTGNVSQPFRQRQRTAILLLFVSNPTRRHRHLHCLCYFKRRHRGTRTKF